MPSTLPERVEPRHRKSCAPDGEALRKKLAAHAEAGLNLGRWLTRAIALSGQSPKEVAYELGYADQSAVSRWLNNAEPPNLTRLWKLRALRRPLVIALAEETKDIAVNTVLTVPSEQVA
ncbi:MAG TPA: hypothetical protein VG538_05875 [Vicinamibacterales bacterium]|jgi:hypothetical protein|nr:hypothetical protein [Vicinamibacterales bacterium]